MTNPTGQDWLDKVRKLLTKAEKAGTPEEAEAFSGKAQELMLKHSIDAAMLGQQPESTDAIGSRRFEIHFYPRPKVSLLNGIAKAFGCQTVYVPGGGSMLVARVYGWESDLDIIEVLFASLAMQAERASTRRWRDLTLAGQTKGLNGRSFTTSFLIGFADTVADRLERQRNGAVQEAEDTRPGTGLVLVDRKQAVDREFHRQHPRLRSTGSSVSSHAGFHSGQDAGNRADLGSGPRLGATGSRALGR